MPKRDPRAPFRRAFRALRRRAYTVFHRFGRQTDEAFSEVPIDFSAPSVPYYENLASRLSFARVVLYMALFVFVVVTLISNHRLITYENLYYLAKDIGASTLTAQSEADRLSYPISATEGDFAAFRGGLVTAGSDVVTVMSGSGRQTLSVNVDYADPEVRASDKYFVTFDRGEPSFSVYNSFVQVHKELTDFPVYDAAVADDGTCAILTRSRDYTSEVAVYDDDMEPIFIVRRTGYVTGLAIAPDGSCLGVVSIEETGGVFETKISLIRIGNHILEESVTVHGSVGSMAAFTTSDRLAVLLSDRLMVFKTDATITAEVSLEGRTALLGNISDGQIALLTRDNTDLSVEYLMTFDHNGRRQGELRLTDEHLIQISGGADDMAFGGDTLYLRAGETLMWLDSDRLTITATATVSHDTLDILPVDSKTVMVCTPAYTDRYTDGS